MGENVFDRLVVSEKIILSGTAILSVFVAVILFANISPDALAWACVTGIVSLVISFEIYIFFSYISDRFENRFVRVPLNIRGVSSDSRTYVAIGGALFYRFTGEYNGTIKIRGGMHDIAFQNGTFSTSTYVNPTDNLMICVNVNGPEATVDLEYKEIVGTEDEVKAGLRSYNRVNLFVFFMTNFLMVLAVLRILYILEII